MSRWLVGLLVIVSLLPGLPEALASDSHSHSPHEAVEEGGGVVMYTDRQDGVNAQLEFSNVRLTGKGVYAVKCDTRVFLRDDESGNALVAKKILIRTTTSHGSYGDARPLLPVGEKWFGTELILTEGGLQHFLIIADIPGKGTKKFHFHHTF